MFGRVKVAKGHTSSDLAKERLKLVLREEKAKDKLVKYMNELNRKYKNSDITKCITNEERLKLKKLLVDYKAEEKKFKTFSSNAYRKTV